MENKGLKILVVVIACFGILSLIFLATSRKKPVLTTDTPIQKQNVGDIKNKEQLPTPAAKEKVAQTSSAETATANTKEERISTMKSQWQNCKNSASVGSEKFFWEVNVTEAIPEGGTYAKALLGGDQAFPVQITIKADSEYKDKLKSAMAIGKTIIVRNTCSGLASDGSVMIQAF